MVYLLLAEGFEEVEAIAPLDLLRRAHVDVKTVGVTGRAVTGAHGLRVAADLTMEEAHPGRELEMLILPGGSPGCANLNASRDVHTMIDTAAQRGIYIAAICAAPTILAQKGMLAGTRAVCYPGMEKQMTDANLLNKAVVVDENIITARGMGVALDFGLELVRLLCGEETARELRYSCVMQTENR